MIDTNASQKHQCPCCGYLTLNERGGYEICKVCFWEDDDLREIYGHPTLQRLIGPNHIHLWQGRENFLFFGVCEARFKQYVRPPRPNEIP
jgi:hypothetical protein